MTRSRKRRLAIEENYDNNDNEQLYASGTDWVDRWVCQTVNADPEPFLSQTIRVKPESSPPRAVRVKLETVN
jgi:hypothetical protein